MKSNVIDLATVWVTAATNSIPPLSSNMYCATRDVFQARLDKMTTDFLEHSGLPEGDSYLIAALTGEIGNNSFDHNLGNWPDSTGIFFSYDLTEKNIVLADRGRGILATLKKVKPELANDMQALETAFKEKISGRAPENRGNGLKFVRQTVHDQKLHLNFSSGLAKAELNEQFRVATTEKTIHGCLAVLQF